MTPFERVSFSGVSKVFGRERALGNVTLELPAGRISVLLGSNGAGKSTVLGILSLLLRPTSGEVHFGDVAHAEAFASLRGLVGLVAHETMLYGDLTGRENLRFFERLYGKSGRALGLLGRLGLEEAADRPVRTYSRGMQQRLQIARALVGEPHLLVLDEPFSGLDQKGIALVRGLLGELKGQGAVIALATHDLGAIAGLADQVAVLKRGQLAFFEKRDAPFDSVEEIYARHA